MTLELTPDELFIIKHSLSVRINFMEKDIEKCKTEISKTKEFLLPRLEKELEKVKAVYNKI